MKQFWIWLSTRSRVTDAERLRLLEHFGDAQGIYCAQAQQLRQVEGLRKEALEDLCDKDLQHAKAICRYCDAKDIRILTLPDSSYPDALRNIEDPPIVLYCKGDLPDLNAEPLVGVVGTREPSPYGLRMCTALSRELAQSGAVIVSGMAKGIDACATEQALQAGAPVIGVLGCGVDWIYPACNRRLFLEMEKKGCLISEYPPSAPPAKWNFPRRNRIISGLSCCVLVAEAPEKSGALITARQAVEQGREVFAVPCNLDSEQGRGCNQLLRREATAATCAWDILELYAGRYPDKLRKPESAMQPLSDKKSVDKETFAPYSDVVAKEAAPLRRNAGEEVFDLQALSEEEQLVLSQMQDGCQHVDELAERIDMPVARLLSVLTILSVKGLVSSLPGGIVEKL